jgi:hypothetical protein
MKQPETPSPDGSTADHPQNSSRFGILRGSAAPPQAETTIQVSLAGDILYGAYRIAKFLYGDGKLRRKVYNLIETERLPHFRLGATVCARKSVLMAWIAEQEAAR